MVGILSLILLRRGSLNYLRLVARPASHQLNDIKHLAFILFIDRIGGYDECPNQLQHLVKEVFLEFAQLIRMLVGYDSQGLMEHIQNLLEATQSHEPFNPIELQLVLLSEKCRFMLRCKLVDQSAFFKKCLHYLEHIEHLMDAIGIENVFPFKTCLSI